MKIGIFTDSFRPYTSGVVRSIEVFTREFSKKGHKVYIFGPDTPVFTTRSKHEDGVYRFLSIPAPNLSNFNLPIPISAQLRTTIKKIGLDVIHVHSPFLLGRLGAHVARRMDIPLVFTYHTMYDQYAHYLPFPEKASKKIIISISRDFSNKCNLVITPSTPVKNYIEKIGVTVPIKVNPTGIELDEFTNTDNKWLYNYFKIDENNKILLFVGRLGKEKNIPFLIRSFKEILKSHPCTTLVLIGNGPSEDSLKKQCMDLGIMEKVVFTGLLSRYKIVHCYASSHIFTFPSVTETQGLVIGEAKAAGLPVVSVKAFGTEDMVVHEEDGFLTEVSEEAFIEKINKLLSDQELYNYMSRKALENVHYLSSTYCAETMLRSYEEII